MSGFLKGWHQNCHVCLVALPIGKRRVISRNHAKGQQLSKSAKISVYSCHHRSYLMSPLFAICLELQFQLSWRCDAFYSAFFLQKHFCLPGQGRFYPCFSFVQNDAVVQTKIGTIFVAFFVIFPTLVMREKKQALFAKNK